MRSVLYPFFAWTSVPLFLCVFADVIGGASNNKEFDQRNAGSAPCLELELMYGPLGLAAPSIGARSERVLGVRRREVR